MDVFQSTVTTCAIIYRFLDSYSQFSTEAQSLSARFKWDARVLQHFVDHFSRTGSTQALAHGSSEDVQLLESSAEYLALLLRRANSITARISARRGWLREINKATWFLHRNDLKELEGELFEWTRRLDMRLVALPKRVRDIITLDGHTEGSVTTDAQCSPSFATQRRIEQFLRLGSDAKKRQWENMWIDDPLTRIELQSYTTFGRFMIGRFEGRDVLLEHKQYPAHFQEDQQSFQTQREEVGIFAAALKSIVPDIAGLLRCQGFTHESDPPRFTLVHEIPILATDSAGSGLDSVKMRSLDQLIAAKDRTGNRLPPAHSLSQRIELARKLATGVLFLHAIDWVHKSISSQNILVLEQSSLDASSRFPRSLGQPYLVNFQWARGNGGETDPMSRAGDRLWVEEIYHHPDRQGRAVDVRYCMSHDIYSLGVVLLELGIWRPLTRYSADLRDADPGRRKEVLLSLAEESAVSMGNRYRRLVKWCLELGTSNVQGGGARYAMHVLGELEELRDAMA
ncbi:hypothetical protein BJY00DRAFT_307840 [Aspergillus carlsbadensis]|nr:hypothetical protein BJY00DRAFT_307840 [Aspergillus carlsbadensis]